MQELKHLAQVETPWGAITYLPRDMYIGKGLTKYHEFSWYEAALFKELVKPECSVIEVGANIGCHTIALAQMTESDVHAWEPGPELCSLLRTNTAPFPRVRVIEAAAGAARGRMLLPHLDFNAHQNFGAFPLNEITDPEARLPTASVAPIDDFHPAAPVGFMKIDVEGMEVDVLVGARGVITRHHPRLYVENDRKDKSSRLIALLESMDYRLFWHLPPLFRPDNHAGDREDIFPGIMSVNMVGIHHQERGFNFEILLENEWCLGPVVGLGDTYRAAFLRRAKEQGHAEEGHEEAEAGQEA